METSQDLVKRREQLLRELQIEIGLIIETIGVPNTLMAIAQKCEEKAQHCQDMLGVDSAVEMWRMVGEELRNCAQKVSFIVPLP